MKKIEKGIMAKALESLEFVGLSEEGLARVLYLWSFGSCSFVTTRVVVSCDDARCGLVGGVPHMRVETGAAPLHKAHTSPMKSRQT